ncbi:hypothetical protein [Streptomyces canarius]|uniref:Uncharacterized protein n=1 Tax=Streptomyces canarius TaxID=285453 RepID=A0ABQ3CXB4_9ACTN|nr:hypothetical protein GCM10010345_58390 [Streptomyces canarius]
MTMQHDGPGESRDLEINPVPSREPVRVPRCALPYGEREPGTAYQVVHDGLALDGTARPNLAADLRAGRLMAECAEKNMINKDGDRIRRPRNSTTGACTSLTGVTRPVASSMARADRH